MQPTESSGGIKGEPGQNLIPKMMNQKYKNHLQRSLELAKELIILSDEGESDSLDNGCRILYGIMRDCAYKIKTQAENETRKHVFKTIEDKFAHPNAQP